ncbi:MAG TPA: tetratricopeptide repeat protein, partial [Gemmata sp.]|nr:tetratricopeptide repeat protein [Gemmata sp.]
MSATYPPASSTSSPLPNTAEGETIAITATPTRRRRGGLILQTGLVVCCSFTGLAVSMALGSGRDPNPNEPDPTHPSISESEGSSTHEHDPAVHEPDPALEAHQIDMLIRSGNFDHALRLCQSVSRAAFGSDERLLIYREGLCLEALGRWTDARETYKKASQPNPDLPIALWARALLGQARCALAKGDVATSQDLLSQVLLRSGDPSCQGQQILGECLFLLGRAEVQTLPPPPPLDPFDITAIAWPPLDGGLDRYLDWLPAEPPPTAHHEAKTHPTPDTAHHEAKDHPAPDTAHHEAKGQPNPDTAHHEAKDQPTTPESGWLAPFFHRDSVRLKQAEWPITHQLRAIGTSVGMKVKIEPKAEEKLAAISMAIDLERAPLSAVLTSLTRKYGFSWRIADGVIAIEPAGHPNETAQRELALQMLRQGLAFAPEHPRARAARINAANLDLGAGRRRKAAVEYRQFLEIEPHAAESVYATYNLGLIELSNENWPVAQARFLDTIDRGPESKWADLGWWWLGRTQLDTGDTTAARKPFQIAREAKTRVVAAAAELGTAACA